LLHQPVEVKVSSGATTGDHIEQNIIRVPEGEDKFKKLLDLINQDEFEKVLIFAETKRLVDRINKKLNNAGVKANLIHGNKSQNTRKKALDQFKRGNIQVLVATDVAARGLDISDVTHVINYQVPQNFESYVHRIGRTGRAGKGGKAFTFVN
jgi:ATP-dependent RNA helicase RhlE